MQLIQQGEFTKVKKFLINFNESKVIFYVINILAFGIILFLTNLFPMYADDFPFSKMFGSNNAIKNVSDFFKSLNDYYCTAGGRLISVAIIQALTQNKIIYDVLNALVHVGLVNVICIYIYGKERRDNLFVITAFLMLWFFLPTYGGIALWLSASVMYVWTILAVLVFGLFYWQRYYDEKIAVLHLKFKDTILLLLGGFIAGLSLEPSACILMLALFLYIIYKLKNHKKFLPQEVIGIIFALAGFAVLMSAPGNYARLHAVEEYAVESRYILFRIARETYYSALYLIMPLCVVVLLTALSAENTERNFYEWFSLRNSENKIRPQVLILFFAFISVAVMTFSAGFALRVFVTPVVLLIIAAGLAFKKAVKRNISVLSCLIALVIIFFIAKFSSAVKGSLSSGQPIMIQTHFILDEATVQ